MNSYTRFFSMIFTSTLVMLVLMYLNTYSIDHVFFSETRLYMTIYMGAAMAIIMLLFMLHMYENKSKNITILLVSFTFFIAGFFLVRSQATIEDKSWMKAMIPHHSIAVLTSERAGIEDLRVKKLANQIIEAQRREIKEMKWLIQDIKKNGIAKNQVEANNRPIPQFKGDL
ncbi:MAG TPA: DUF305 domain-containing protein [Oligoflexia bacterium]|nr:DUF305 domain-containing protein [bacterium]HMQ11366.1 DUF305 domain-containing protein [Oligoflexia bacterium]HMR24068.1 DUF305 domain-containing protein [Oligoflexia bacterium]